MKYLFVLLFLQNLVFSASWQVKGCKNPEVNTIGQSVISSNYCLNKAKRLLNHHWDELKTLHQWKGKATTQFKILFLEGNRDFYLNLINAILIDYDKGKIKYQCDYSCPQDRLAYTIFYFDRWPVAPIYICPSFFIRGDKKTTISHELGRLYGSMNGETSWDSNNVYVWDNILEVLCEENI